MVTQKFLVPMAVALFTAACVPRESPEESSPLALAGDRLSEGEVATVLANAGFPDNVIPTMVCIAKYESSFYTQATNRNWNGSVDYGLFQINNFFWITGCGLRSANQLMNVETNTRCALTIYRQQGLNAWYGYQYHRSECNSYSINGSSRGSSNAAQLNACLKHGGGNACYSKWGATPPAAAAPRQCDRTALERCRSFGGGNACYAKHACTR